MSRKVGTFLLLIAALVAFATGIAHLSCIALGPECYAVQMAPKVIIESAINQTLLAPIVTIFASAIFITLALYALAGAGLIVRLPCLKLAIYSIATVCVIRGLLPIQLWWRKPELVNDIVLYVGVAWLLTGLCYGIGFYLMPLTQPRQVNCKK